MSQGNLHRSHALVKRRSPLALLFFCLFSYPRVVLSQSSLDGGGDYCIKEKAVEQKRQHTNYDRNGKQAVVGLSNWDHFPILVVQRGDKRVPVRVVPTPLASGSQIPRTTRVKKEPYLALIFGIQLNLSPTRGSRQPWRRPCRGTTWLVRKLRQV